MPAFSTKTPTVEGVLTPPAPGQYEIGSQSGSLLLRTFRRGIAARVGHDLLIKASNWHGRISIPENPAAQPTVSVSVDMRELQVLEGTGGVRPLSEADKRDIKGTLGKVLQTGRYPEATFTSTSAHVRDEGATVEGELKMNGQSHPLRLEVHRREDGVIAGSTSVLQSTWGIKPYTGFFGALRLRDAVDVEFSVSLPGA